MKFTLVAHAFEAISKVSSRIEITKILADVFTVATPQEAQIISYLSLGLLRAPYQGTQFNIADKIVTRVIAALLDETPEQITKLSRDSGDLGSVVAAYGNWRVSHEHSVTTVFEDLVKLEEISGVGSQEEKMGHLLKVLQEVDPLSAQYIIRIVLGKLRLGFSDMTIIDALSWMLVGDKSLHERIEHAYNLCADIGLIVKELKKDGIEGLDKISIILGIPIRMAAAERLPTARDIIDKLGPCVAQPKLDGFRLQVHLDYRDDKKKLWFYSRNLQDMSPMFPDLTKALLPVQVKTLIAEGEAVAYDEQTGGFVPFQETVKRKRKHGIEEAAAELPLKLFLFDILYLNGEPLLNKAEHTRYEILKELFPGTHHEKTVSVIDEKRVSTPEELERYFLENITAGLEGLVVKKTGSHYQPGKRNFNWIKLKRQEHGHLEDTLDTVILGYYHGEGKRASFGIGAFLVGLYNPHHDRFETVAKIGTGLKDDEWIELKKKCDKLKVSQEPHNVVCAKELFPDVWVSPELVCLVRADEITISPTHSAGKTAEHLGYALRFPRFMGYRTDKSATEATTTDELKTLFKQQKQRKTE